MAMCLVAVAPSGCRSADSPEVVSVFAASSLTESFAEMERAYEAAHPGVNLRRTHAGSQVLRLQIEQGAGADVYASANPAHVEALVEGGHVATPATFAHNELVVIVPPDNPAGIESFADLTHARRLVIGTPQVPFGAYARAVLDRADADLGGDFRGRVLSRVVSEESNVRLARAKVALGEADAAIVYRTDVNDAVGAIPIPSAYSVRAAYPLAIATTASPRAASFRDFVLSSAGQDILLSHGFGGAR